MGGGRLVSPHSEREAAPARRALMCKGRLAAMVPTATCGQDVADAQSRTGQDPESRRVFTGFPKACSGDLTAHAMTPIPTHVLVRFAIDRAERSGDPLAIMRAKNLALACAEGRGPAFDEAVRVLLREYSEYTEAPPQVRHRGERAT